MDRETANRGRVERRAKLVRTRSNLQALRGVSGEIGMKIQMLRSRQDLTPRQRERATERLDHELRVLGISVNAVSGVLDLK